jgi:DedD protein
MAFFKFRKGGDEQPTSAAPAAESVEAMRKRARHRLIGAALLVALGVVGFPMLFDSQPRPIAVDIPIEIPDKNRVKPLGNLPIDAPAAQTAGVVGTEVVIAPSASASAVVPAVPVAEPVVAAPAASTPRPAAKPASAPASTPTKVDAPAPPKQLASVPVAAKADDSSKAQALLDGKVPEAKISGADARFIVQVGAFSDAEKAREARLKLERAGLKTYTQVVEPKEGKRTRVRVGPFLSRQDAENAAEKIKQLDLPASILEL